LQQQRLTLDKASEDENLVWLAIENGAIVDNTTFIRACQLRQTEIVRQLLELQLERGVNPSAHDNTCISMCM
jgi:hypothetical protein